MEAIVLAGGAGTRLRQVVPDEPKPMAPVAGRPFLEHLLGALARKGFDRVVLSLGYLADKVVAHFGGRFSGMELLYEIERTPLGTGGATRQALARCRADHAFVFNGDTYLDLEVTALEAQWQAQRGPIVVACEVPDTARYGRLTAIADRVAGFSEKGASGPGLINAGCYVLPAGVLDGFASGQPFSLETEVLVKWAGQKRLGLFVSRGRFIDIGTPEDYARAQIELAGESS
jgi:D-glycero-alpha-D-manno-heptose 1-phosphate guanylyltransferase